MILVVADTGTINYLVQIGCIELLSQLAQKTVLPATVQAELNARECSRGRALLGVLAAGVSGSARCDTEN
jgi:predicted nucleic acid-binding protein